MASIFDILVLPARREIIRELRQGRRSVGELADALGMSQPVMSKQLRILRDAGVVSMQADGQRRWYELRPEPFVEIAEWLEPYRTMWERRLDLLGDQLDAIKEEEEDPE